MNETPNSNTKSMVKYFFRASAEDFKNIPGSPVAYWATKKIFTAFVNSEPLEKIGLVRQGASTSDNSRFLRLWQEVSISKARLSLSSLDEANKSGGKWFPYNKGGDYRKWYGNHEFLINYQNDGKELKEFQSTLSQGWTVRLKSREYYFRPTVSWPKISSGLFSARYYPEGFIFDVAGCCYFPQKSGQEEIFVSLLNSKVSSEFLKLLSPTLNFEIEQIKKIPFASGILSGEINNNKLFELAQSDWNSYETSWNFTALPLLSAEHQQATLKGSYQKLRDYWREMTLEMQRLEEENNRIFIEAYGLQDELTPDVPLKEITLTCNPHYRYGGDKTEEELEALLLADTMRELVSYAVGCMFGRYSLDKEGLILANQGETLADYLAQVPQPSFPVDDDNVIPVLDGDWFADDITLRFRQFLRVAFGDAHYEDNLVFIEQALNVKGKRNYSLRDYFLSDFYTDHVKRYKKRPIYWLFSSPKGSFNALIYMHRYRSDTVSVVLKYLRDYRDKLIDERKHNMAIVGKDDKSQGEKIRAQKEIERLSKVLAELEDYEREVLYPLATEQKAIDLDDGVKVNYLKFGGALKKIVGLDSKSED